MTREQVFALCFFGLLLVLLYQIGIIFRPFLLPVLWAVILARLAFPLQRRLTAGTSFLQGAKVVSVFLLGQVTDLAKNAFAFTFSCLVMMITLFFLLKDGPQLYQSLYELIPLTDAHKQKFFTRLDRTTMAVIQSLVVTAIVQGLLAGAAYWMLGVPSTLVLTALTALFSFLPLGGTALVWVPVTIYLFWIGPVWKGIVMLAWGAGVVSTIDQVIKPMLIGHGAQLPTLFLFFSILGGLAAYGFIGLLLGPILLAILITAIQIYREDYPSAPAPELVPESSEVSHPPER